jgi:ribosomal protein S27E
MILAMTMKDKRENSESAELMYVKCAYCGNWMDVKPGHMNRISHAICPDCFKKVVADQEAGKEAQKKDHKPE